MEKFARQSRQNKKWPNYELRDYTVYPETITSVDNIPQKLHFEVPDKGLFNRAILRFSVQFNSNDGDTSNDSSWTGFQFVNSAVLKCGGKEIFRMSGASNLASVAHINRTDSKILESAVPKTPVFDAGADSNGTTYMFYCPLSFGCFNTVDQLLDPQFIQNLTIDVSIKSCKEVLLNTLDYTLSEVVLKCQMVEFIDYYKFYQTRYSKPYSVSTKNMFEEPVRTFSGTNGTLYQSDQIKIHCDKKISHTFILVVPDQNMLHMNPVELSTVQIKDHGTIIFDVASTNEDLILHHMQYLNEPGLNDNVESATESFIINWGVQAESEGNSNYKSLKDSNMYLEFTCTPTVTATHKVYIYHEYYHDLSFDKDGVVEIHDGH